MNYKEYLTYLTEGMLSPLGSGESVDVDLDTDIT